MTWMERQPRSRPSSPVIEVLQAVQIVQVPGDGGMLAVDLERVERLVAARVTGGLKGRQRTVLKARQKSAGVVDAHLLHLAGEVCLRSLMKVSVMAVTSIDAAVQPHGGVDAVRQQVAGHAAAGHVDVQAPQALAALRQVGRDGPVLQKLGAVVEDLAQPPFVDQLLGQRHRRHAPVVVPDHVRHAGFLDRLRPCARIRRRCGPAASRTAPSCPACAAAMAISACVSLGLAISIRSISGRSTSLRQSVSMDA